MKNRYACLGLQGVTESPELKKYILENWDYAVPGYGCNYLHYGTRDYIEFEYCFKGNMGGQDAVGVDMHFSSNTHWTVWLDSMVDTESTAHKYFVRKSADGSDVLPMRIVCPDVLAQARPGDEMYGQVVAFVKQGTIQKDVQETSGVVTNIDGEAVQITGRIDDVNVRAFHYRDFKCGFLELDVETDLGLITVLTTMDALDQKPEVDDIISATAYISMDVAVPSKRNREFRPAFYVEKDYPNLPGNDEDIRYNYGFDPGSKNAARVLLAVAETKDAFRFGRCCADSVMFDDGSDDTIELSRWEVVDRIAEIVTDATAAEEILNIKDEDGELYPFSGGVVINNGQKIIVLDTNEDGFVFAISVLSGDQYQITADHELHLIKILAEALCNAKIRQLQEIMAINCVYRSDYSGKREYGIADIIEKISSVSEKLDEKTRYSYEIVPASDEILEDKADDLPGVYHGKWCIRLYQGPVTKLAAIVFVRSNDAGEISNILLSRDGDYLKAFAGKSSTPIKKRHFPKVDELLEWRFGTEDTVRQMRDELIPGVDMEEVYVWQRADQYMLDWFYNNSYRMDSTEIFDDCIGYACTRRGEKYAVYVYAYGKHKTAMLDGDYCAKLRDYELSKDRTVLIVYLHVTAEKTDDGDTEFFVGMYGSKDQAPHVWKLGWIGEKSVILYYPRKEMDDLNRRLMAAYNAKRRDILQTILSDSASFDHLQGGRSLNSAVYGSLLALREDHGVMKTAYVRYNDVVYNEVPYIDGYCYISFSANNQDRIENIELYPLDESYRELIVTDEVLMSHPMDEIPDLQQVEFLPASEISRLSMRLTFANGEIRRYDVPGDFGDDEVFRWLDKTFTEKMFRNGRIADPVSPEEHRLFRAYPRNYPGIEFINGAAISAVELYHNSYPLGEFKYRDGREVFVLQDFDQEEPFAVGRINDLDPANPLYLFDKEKKIAKTIPAQYQDTPIICYPFCGGFSEGLLMVSTMGELDLQYHHNRYACAGMWGWLDTDLQTVIEPKYVYAMNFWNGRAIVCKGEWTTVEKDGKLQYWCENEGWGVIDQQDREIVPCQFEELYEIDGTDRLYFVRETVQGGGGDGHFTRIDSHYAIYDVQEQKVILELDFDFDMGYMFNECFVADGDILVFVDHLPGKGEDLIYAYDLHNKKFIAYAESYTERTLNGESKVVVNKDGQDIIVF